MEARCLDEFTWQELKSIGPLASESFRVGDYKTATLT